MTVIHQTLADIELGLILWTGAFLWAIVYGPRTIRRAVGRWLGTRRDHDDRVFEEYRRRQVAEGREAMKRESHVA